MKCILAILLVCAHVSSEKLSFPVYIDAWFSLYILVVPFFFTTSAFFFFKKLENESSEQLRKQYYKQYTKRILLMYLVWSLIYLCFKLAEWVHTDTFSLVAFAQHIFYSITYTSYPTIWFLPSLWVAVSLVYLCMKAKLPLSSILVIASLMYIFGWCWYTLAPNDRPLPELYESYKLIFKSVRNGLFNGFIFAALGVMLAKEHVTNWGGRTCKFYYTMSILLLILTVAEALLSKRYLNPKVDANFCFMLVPLTYYFVMAVAKTELKPRPIYLTCRNLSTLLFLSQRIFLTAIPILLPASILAGITQNPYVGLAIFLGSTLVFSLVIVQLSKRYKLLKILW